MTAKIAGLPEGPCEIAFASSTVEALGENEVTGTVDVATESGGSLPTPLDNGRIVVTASGAEAVTVTYPVKMGLYHQLTEASYLDESRGLIHPQQILLQVAGQTAEPVTLSFVMPQGWRVTAGTSPIEGVFRLKGKRVTPFYLGDAAASRETVGEATCVVDTGWPGPPEEPLQAFSRQVRYRGGFVRDSEALPLLVVFLPIHRDDKVPAVHSLDTPGLTVITDPGASSAGRSRTKQSLDRELARVLLVPYLPVLAYLPPSSARAELEDYLALKACLKTGIVTQTEFFEAVAAGLWESFAGNAETPATKILSGTGAKQLAEALETNGGNSFLLDLALTFYGSSAKSLEEFLLGNPILPAEQLGWEREMRLRLEREGRAAKVLTGWSNGTRSNVAGDALRPFGLLFERKTLPAFPFELTEGFQVAHLKVKAAQGLQPGDRVVAINERHLVMPDDLLKYRSRLEPGQYIQLSIERSGLPMKLRLKVSEEIWLKLEVNKLADADKREKLDLFLRRDGRIISQ